MTCVIGSSVTSAIAFSILSPIVGGASTTMTPSPVIRNMLV